MWDRAKVMMMVMAMPAAVVVVLERVWVVKEEMETANHRYD